MVRVLFGIINGLGNDEGFGVFFGGVDGCKLLRVLVVSWVFLLGWIYDVFFCVLL